MLSNSSYDRLFDLSPGNIDSRIPIGSRSEAAGLADKLRPALAVSFVAVAADGASTRRVSGVYQIETDPGEAGFVLDKGA